MAESTTPAETITDETAAGIGAGPEGGPIAGDPSSEPVATAAQSWRAGRTGPPSIAQDSDATWHAPEGVAQLDPGAILPAETVVEGGKIAIPQVDPASFGAGPYGGDTPADETPNVVTATKPGTDKPGPDELPFGTPTASDSSGTGGPVSIPAAKTAEGSTEAGAATTPTADAPKTGASDTTTSTDAPTSPGSASSESGTTAAVPTGTSEPVGTASSSESGTSTPAAGADAPTATTGGTAATTAPTTSAPTSTTE